MQCNRSEARTSATSYHQHCAAVLCAQVVALVESLLARLRFIPQPEAQERYLAGAVGAVLQQAHGRILRMLQQADVFKDLTGYAWLPRVGTERPSGALQHLCGHLLP